MSDLKTVIKNLQKENEGKVKLGKKKKEKKKKSKQPSKKWEKITRSNRLLALACPKPIRLAPWPNPLFYNPLPIPVAKSALYGKIPERILKLAEPKVRNLRNTKCVQPSRPDQSANRAKPLKAPSLSRIISLSKPKPNKRHVHPRCSKVAQDCGMYCIPRRQHMVVNSEDWVKHQKWLKQNAKPKRVFRQPIEKKNPEKITKEQLEESINRLSTVPVKRQYVKKTPKEPTKPRPHGPIIPLNLSFVNRLSKPRKISSETRLNLEYKPGVISKAALKAVASKRTIELAQPRAINRTGVDKEYKEDPFSVSKKALKYKASKRIKELALPRRR